MSDIETIQPIPITFAQLFTSTNRTHNPKFVQIGRKRS